MYDTIWRLVCGTLCTIRSEGFYCVTLYDINLGATHTTIPSTRGVEIPISLVSSATDSIQRCVAVFKLYRYQPQTLSLSSCVNRVILRRTYRLP